MTTPRPAAEAAEGTRPAGQAEALRPGPCTRCYADGYPACMCVVDYDEPAAGVEPPVVAVAGREASATVERRHREAAWLALDFDGSLPHESSFAGHWVANGSLDGAWELGHEAKVAQALANAEAYGRASALVKP